MAETRAELVTALKAPVFDLTQEYLAGASAPVSRGAVLFHCLSTAYGTTSIYCITLLHA